MQRFSSMKYAAAETRRILRDRFTQLQKSLGRPMTVGFGNYIQAAIA
jgi:hypothetical protein